MIVKGWHVRALSAARAVRMVLYSLMLVFSAVSIDEVNAEWKNLWSYDVTGTLPQPLKRAAHGLISFNDSLYVYGGVGDTSVEEDHEFEDTWRFDLVNATWSKVIDDTNDLKPSHRFHHASALHSNGTVDEMIIFGGLSISNYNTSVVTPSSTDNTKTSQYNDVWRLTLDAGAEHWTHDVVSTSSSDSVPDPRSEVGSVVHKDKLYIFGGIAYNVGDTDPVPVDYDDLWEYDLSTCTWTQLEPLDGIAPGARFSHSVSIFTDGDNETYIYVFSGRHLSGLTWKLLGDAWVYSLTTKLWTPITLSSRLERAYTSVVMMNGMIPQMWFFGGYYKPQEGTNGYVFDDVVNGQLTLNKLPAPSTDMNPTMKLYHGAVASIDVNDPTPPLRYNHKSALWRDTMIIHGGSYQTQRGDVWLYNLTSAVLQDDTSNGMPVGIEMLVYILASFMLFIVLVLIVLIIRWRRIDRRNLEMARRRGVVAMRGVPKERLEQMEIVKYKKPTTPTNEMVELGSPTEESQEDVCPICLIEFEVDESVRNLPCKHLFHVECIDEWLKRNTTCPMCKNNLDLETIEIDTSEGRVPLTGLPVTTSMSAAGTMIEHNQLPSPPRLPRRSQQVEHSHSSSPRTSSTRSMSSSRALVRPPA